MLRNKLILYPEYSYKLTSLFFETHNNIGRFRNEKQYSDYFEKLLIRDNINYNREFTLPQSFDGEKTRRNIVDFLVYNKIIIDFKTKTHITKDDYFQMQRYLVSANKELGLIVNFRQTSIRPKRVLNLEIHKNNNSEHSNNNSD